MSFRELASTVSVLLVDDAAAVAGMIVGVQQSLGHTAFCVANAPAALGAVASGLRPDVLVTDMNMPVGMSGLALAAALRMRLPGVPVVLATGGHDDSAPLRRPAGSHAPSHPRPWTR